MKKRLQTVAVVASFLLTGAGMAFAQGWPANYKGVMLQGFAWDSYNETSWSRLTQQSDELSMYFSLIWIPNSGTTSSFHHNSSSQSMGYDPCFWLQHNSCFGTEQELRTMISTFKQKGTGIIEDVVVNHKNGLNSWADFPQENVTASGKSYKIQWNYTDAAYPEVCNNDEANSNPESPVRGKLTGSADTGDNFDGFRDLDHTNATVRQNIKTYLDYLRDELGYAGFRYDMVKGFAASYVREYNSASNPTFSVGEYFDNKASVEAWVRNTGYSSAAFDFGLKFKINEYFGGNKWDLSDKGMAADASLSQYAVTFVENHDTNRDANKLNSNVLAANAFILALPGTPCIFWPHWTAHKEELKKMIDARREAGISNTSKIIAQHTEGGGYVTVVQGENRNILVTSGYISNFNPVGYRLVSSGTAENPNYAFYISTDEVKTITVYVKADAAPNLYAWTNGNVKLNGEWPGTVLANQKYVGAERYYYATFATTEPSINVILNRGQDAPKTNDITGISADSYFTYDGGTGYNNVTADVNTQPIETLTASEGTYAYFVAPASWTSVNAWAWSGSTNYTGGTWPGEACAIVGQDKDGNNIWKWTYTGAETTQPTDIIFNQGKDQPQTADLGFVNGAAYATTGYLYTALDNTAINDNVLGRTFTQNVPATICLPFDLNEEETNSLQGTVYAFTSEEAGVLKFTSVSSMEAYQPYVFIADATGQSFAAFNSKPVQNGEPKSVGHGRFVFHANTAQRSLVSDAATTYYAFRASDGGFSKAGTIKGMTLKPYRSYFSTTLGGEARLSRFELATDMTTGLKAVFEPGAAHTGIFTLGGTRLSGKGNAAALPKGIYIQNNRKVIIK